MADTKKTLGSEMAARYRAGREKRLDEYLDQFEDRTRREDACENTTTVKPDTADRKGRTRP